AIAGHSVIADQVGLPLHATRIYVHQQRSVARHHHEIAVALHAGHPRSIAQGTTHIRRGRALARRPFADEDLWSLAIGVVVVMHVVEELLRTAIEVIVDEIG